MWEVVKMLLILSHGQAHVAHKHMVLQCQWQTTSRQFEQGNPCWLMTIL